MKGTSAEHSASDLDGKSELVERIPQGISKDVGEVGKNRIARIVLLMATNPTALYMPSESIFTNFATAVVGNIPLVGASAAASIEYPVADYFEHLTNLNHREEVVAINDYLKYFRADYALKLEGKVTLQQCLIQLIKNFPAHTKVYLSYMEILAARGASFSADDISTIVSLSNPVNEYSNLRRLVDDYQAQKTSPAAVEPKLSEEKSEDVVPAPNTEYHQKIFKLANNPNEHKELYEMLFAQHGGVIKPNHGLLQLMVKIDPLVGSVTPLKQLLNNLRVKSETSVALVSCLARFEPTATAFNSEVAGSVSLSGKLQAIQKWQTSVQIANNFQPEVVK